MSTKVIASIEAYKLGDAITGMAARMCLAEQRSALASAVSWNYTGEDKAAKEAEAARWERAAQRRFRAVQRLTGALRDLPLKEEQ